MMIMMRIKPYITAFIVASLLTVVGLILFGTGTVGGDEISNVPKREITSEEIKEYNGTDSELPIYIALDGYVYDVSEGRKFYEEGGAYDYLAGKDSTKELSLIGGDIIKRKYPIIGTYIE